MSRKLKKDVNDLLDMIPTLVMVWDCLERSIIYSNRRIYEELGYGLLDGKKDENKWRDLIHLDDLFFFNKLESDFLSSFTTSTFTCNIRLKKYENIWSWYSLSESVFERLLDGNVSKVIISLAYNQSVGELESSLRESNERFKTLADASFGGIGIHDKGLIIDANQELARMSGFQHHELIGMDGLALIAPEFREQVMVRIISGYEKPYEAVGLRKDGTKYPLEIQGKQIPYKGKTVRVTEFRNIEKRKLAQKAIQDMEQSYESIIEFAVDGILIGNRNGVVVKANQMFLKISGREKEDVEGQHISKLFTSQTLEHNPLRFDVLQSGQTLVNERNLVRPDGEIVFVEMHSKMMPDGSYHSIIRDVTHRKKTENAVLESENMFRSVFETANDAIFIMDSQVFLDCNRRTEEMFGVSKEQIVGHSPLDFSPEFQPEGLSSAIMAQEKINEALRGESQYFEWIHRRRNGSFFYTEVSLNRIVLNGKDFIQAIVRDVDQRKRAEKEIQNSENLYRSIIENITDVYYRFDVNRCLTMVSPSGLKLLGYNSMDELLGLHLSKFWDNDEHQITFFDFLRRNGVVKNFVTSIKNKEGKEIHVALSASFLKDGEGNLIATEGIVRDISHRKKVEEALIKSDRVFKHSIDMLCIAGFDGYFKTLNPSWSRILGWNDEELLTKPWIEFVHPDDRKLTIDAMISLVDGKQVYQFENRFICKDGSIRWLSWNSYPYVEEKQIYAIARDVTDRKNVDLELATEQFFMQTLMNNVTDQIYFKDKEGRFIRVNQNVATRFGLKSPKETIGKTDFDFFAPEHATSAFLIEQKIISTGEPVVGIEEEEKWPDGSITWVSTTKMPLRNANGTIVGTFGISRDISDRKRTEDALHESDARLRLLSDNLPLGLVYQIDTGENAEYRKFTYISAGVEKIHGVTPSQVLDDNTCLYSQLLEEDRNFMIEKEKEAFAIYKPFNVEVRFRAPSGDIRWALISSAPRRLQNGHLIWDGIEFDITEKKGAEEALRENEERYRSVLSNTSLVSFILDQNGIFTLSEGTSLSKLGLSPGQVVGMSVFDVYKDVPSILSMSKRALKGETQRGEIEIQGIAFDAIFTPVFDSQGKVRRVIGIANDITEAKKAKDDLIQSYAKNKALLIAIPDLMFIFRKDGLFEDFYAPSSEKLFVPPDSFLGKHVKEVLPAYLSDTTLFNLSNLFKTGESQFYDYQIEIDHQTRFYDARMVKIDDQRAISICRDITERRRTEDSVELERAYFEHLFDSSPEGIVVLDINDCVVRCNQEFTRMFGYTSEETVGKPINQLIVPDELADEGLNLTTTVAKGKLVMHETKRKRKDGSLIHVSILGKPIQFRGGQIAVYGIYRDITDRKKVEEQLIYKNYEIEAQNEEYKLINEELHKAKEKAEESDRLKSAFLANMSHEIRTPMNGILGFSQLLTNPEISEVSTTQYVEVIQSCGNQLLTIINDLIDISKIEANQIVITETELDVNKLLQEQFLLFEKKAESIGIEFSFSGNLPQSQSRITTDAARLKQVLSNLLSNALKFDRSGHVRFGYVTRGKMLEFFVEDTGIGIPQEFQNMIFERFRQVETKLSAQAGGTGLGLAISRAFINKMGGEIWVNSIPDKGSTFFFTIPYKPIFDSQNWNDGQGVEEKDIIHLRKTILIAEDDDVNYYYLSEILSEYSVDLIRATNGKQAIELVKENPKINLVLMDIKMPDIDGHEATTLIKQFRSNLPVIAQTAYAFSSDREKAIEVGCDDYIAKPIERGKLIALLTKYLQ